MAVERQTPRIQEIILPVLREKLPEVQVVSWIPEVSQREFPLLMIRRLGGLPIDPKRLDRAVIEMTAFHDVDLAHCEDVFMQAREVLYDMVDKQTVTPQGHLSSYFETMGPTQFDSPYEDTWRVQALIQLGIRPPRN